MQIVIDIPEEMYNTFKRGIWSSTYDGKKIRDIVMNGIPLPEGHGKLEDESDYNDIVYADNEGALPWEKRGIYLKKRKSD